MYKIMKILATMVSLINRGFKYVVDTSEHFKIDESHALKHSMEVYGFAKRIYESEIKNNPQLEEQREIIYMAAIGHDMCDKKYMDENEGIERYKNYLTSYISSDELEIIGTIIGTMSYSKVKVNGYPNLGKYQLAYHIVREADLLAAYDIDRCIMYSIHKESVEYSVALKRAVELFDSRVFRMRQERLFKTEYSKKESLKLQKKAKIDVEVLKNILDI
jgi:HD superfamily phosphodiesterase